jgi:hypothetical protein
MGFNPIGDLFAYLRYWLYTSGFIDWFFTISSKDPISLAWEIFINGGWVLLVIVLIYGFYFQIFLENRAGQFKAKWKFVLLAIDIPRNNEQTPKAVENIFSAMAGIYTGSNLIEKYWSAKTIEQVSFEIVSIEGHTRYLVYVPTHFRDFVESVIYSQYPDAEINEVSDYVDYESDYVDPKTGQPQSFKQLTFPNPLYKLWGVEFSLAKPYPYPIRTYPEFEHQQTQTFLDPMGNLLEILGKIGPGEQIWLQLVIQPRAPDWGEKAKEVLAKLQGKDYKSPSAGGPLELLSKPVDGLFGWFGEFLSQTVGLGASLEDKKKEEDQWKMFRMSPGERGVLERVEAKLSKQVFKVKYRMIYLGRKEVFAKGRGVTGITGALQQFNTSDANALKPGSYSKTAADYFFVDKRIAKKQNRILRWYCSRSSWYGESNNSDKLMLLNPEELASLWHFPVMTIKASKVDKIESKRSAPPTRLPYMQRQAPVKKDNAPLKVDIQPISPAIPSFNEAPALVESDEVNENFLPRNVGDEVAPPTPIISSVGGGLSESEADSGVPVKRKSAPPPNLPFA